MNQLQVITDLPQWVLALAEDVLIIIAQLTGHSVIPGSVHKVDEKETTDDKNGLDSADR